MKNEWCGQNHKMSNAYVDKFGRYIKWLTWYIQATGCILGKHVCNMNKKEIFP